MRMCGFAPFVCIELHRHFERYRKLQCRSTLLAGVGVIIPCSLDGSALDEVVAQMFTFSGSNPLTPCKAQSFVPALNQVRRGAASKPAAVVAAAAGAGVAAAPMRDSSSRPAPLSAASARQTPPLGAMRVPSGRAPARGAWHWRRPAA